MSDDYEVNRPVEQEWRWWRVTDSLASTFLVLARNRQEAVRKGGIEAKGDYTVTDTGMRGKPPKESEQ